MTRIEVFNHPLVGGEPAVYHADTVGGWLLEHYGDSPSVRVQVFAGAPSGATEITGNIAALIASDQELYTVLESPAGVDPFSWAVFAIAAILAVTAVVLMPKPSMPSNVNRTQSSANNSLSDRSNSVRLLQRVEDIYGTVRAVPSLMMPTYTKYKNNQQYEYGYYCISRGYIDVKDIRDAETLLSDIEGASAAVYYPFTSPNFGSPVIEIGDPITDSIFTARRAEEVDGMTLKAPNQINVPNGALYDFGWSGSSNYIAQNDPHPDFNSILKAGDQVTVQMTAIVESFGPSSATASANTISCAGIQDSAEVGWSVTMTGWSNPANNGTRTVTSVGLNSINVNGAALTTETAPGVSFTFTSPNYSGNYIVNDVDTGIIYVNGSQFPVLVQHAPANVISGSTEWTDWVTLPDVDRAQVNINVIASQGMYRDSGTGQQPSSVSFQMQIERLDSTLHPTGQVETVNGGISGQTSDEVAETVEHVTAWTGPARVRMRRSSDYDFSFSGTVIDEIKWRDLYAISPVSRDHFGNKTTIHTVMRATVRATSLRSRELNCLAARMLPIYNGSEFSGGFDQDGRILFGTIAPTSYISDIIYAIAQDPKIGRRDLATEVDVDQILATTLAVKAMHPEAPQFNYTLDTDTMSFEETIVNVANAGFCVAYRQNGRLRLAFDQAQSGSSALFTHRNKKPDSDTITRKFNSDSEYDGVEFVYVDPDTDTSETIILPNDGSYTKLKKFEIPGIRSFAQAWLRANREYYKLIGQRITIETMVTSEARSLLPNTRIDIVDNTRMKAYDGEVVGQNGLEIILSRQVEFSEGESHSVILNHRDGTPEAIPVEPGSDPNRILLQRLPSEEIVTKYGPDGVRTSFSFASDSRRLAMAYLVQEIDLSDPQYAKINAINYSSDYYQMDTQTIPPRDTIIN